jgi:NADH-quinone oxidoreductase subunit H
MNILIRLQEFFSPLGHYLSYILAYFFETLFLIIFAALSIIVAIYVFRKYMARVQQRIGPNRVGKFGVFQLIADVFKLIGKENILPKSRDDLPYKLAPIVVFMGLMLAFAILPYGDFYYLGSFTITHSEVTIILLFAIISIMPIGDLLAGISSYNKYAILGSLRAVAKDVSFEVPMMLSVIAIVMMASARTPSSLSLESILSTEFLPYGILEPIGLFVFFVSMIARASYSPFDMGESDSELITGSTTEYSGMRFGLFYVGMFGSIFLGSLIVATLYLGGPSGPFESSLGFIWFLIKAWILVIIAFTIWLSMPRIRIDKFVNFGWKYLLPIAVINLILAGIITLGWGL